MGFPYDEANKNFESMFFSPKVGNPQELVLANWRLETHTHDKDDRPNKKAIVFDVLKIDKEEFPIGAKVWKTKSTRLYEAIKPHLRKADEAGRLAVHVYVELTKNNEYRVIDLETVRGVMNGR